MLSGIIGNKTVENILIFLFVNGKCYGTQLKKVFNCSLTTLQNGLDRLEAGEVIISTVEGKVKLYRLNPAYPLLEEIEQLLRKRYFLMNNEEKKRYSILSQIEEVVVDENPAPLKNLWMRLLGIKELTFHARSHTEKGWDGRGKGVVECQKTSDHIILFYEKGSWKGKEGDEVQFKNVYRWTLDEAKTKISLEHLRYGSDQPVFLFHLIPKGKHSLVCEDTHLCSGDAYFGALYYDKCHLHLHWRVIGPKKNEEMDYFYL